MTPEFRHIMYSWKPSSADDPDCIPYQIQRLFGLLQATKQRAVSTKVTPHPWSPCFRVVLTGPCCVAPIQELTASFGWDRGEAFQQNDVQEVGEPARVALGVPE